MNKRIRIILIAVIIVISTLICGCTGGVRPVVDYGNAEAFESALNAGQNLEGEIVRFKADDLHPQSFFGYNIFAGEHLNFVSDRNPNVQVGDIVTVRVTEVRSMFKSWIISYEKVDNAVITKDTITDTVAVNSAEDSEDE
ncbi:MAG: hypothetical protein IJT49_05045 [Clostridia bacterium]|nr:hypothetical protein [Clostridia bacterium]